MTVDNPIQYEVELVEELWNLGWAPFRTAGQAPGCPISADVVAVRDDRIVILNVVVLPTGTSTENVHEENKVLKKAKDRAKAMQYGASDNILVGHAVKKVQEDSWHFKSVGSSKIGNSSGVQELWRVISR